jgi:hypothetical protein
MKKAMGVAMSLAAGMLTGCKDEAGTQVTGETKPYTLDVCVVSDEKLGSMGEAVVFVHEGQEIKLCCKSCKPDFEKEPAKFLAKLAAK